jgi:hypothetical protein
LTQEKEQLVDEGVMEGMSVAPPDPAHDASGPYGASVSDKQKAASEGGAGSNAATRSDNLSGVADEDPLSAHPT